VTKIKKTLKTFFYIYGRDGGAEDARRENNGQTKLWIWKMQDWKMTDILLAKTPNELRGLENDGPLFASNTSRKDSSHLVELGVF